jgi:type IV pilus assembly protein PilV
LSLGRPENERIIGEQEMTGNGSILKMVGRPDAGFTLIEVLIALTILAVGFLAVAQMQITGLMGNRHAMVITEGTTWAQDRMEFLIGLPFNDSRLDISTSHTDTNPPDGYTITWTVVDLTAVAGAKQVNLTASWQDRFGRTRTLQLTGVKNSI